MNATPVLLTEIAGPIARLVLNRPERRNALSWELLRELQAALEHAGHILQALARVQLLGSFSSWARSALGLERELRPDRDMV